MFNDLYFLSAVTIGFVLVYLFSKPPEVVKKNIKKDNKVFLDYWWSLAFLNPRTTNNPKTRRFLGLLVVLGFLKTKDHQ